MNLVENFREDETGIVGRLDHLISGELKEKSISEEHVDHDSMHEYGPDKLHKQAVQQHAQTPEVNLAPVALLGVAFGAEDLGSHVLRGGRRGTRQCQCVLQRGP